VIDQSALNLHCAPMQITSLNLFKRPYSRPAALLTAAVFLSACASVATRLPDVSESALEAEKVKQQDFALTQLKSETVPLLASEPIIFAPIIKA